MKTLMEKAKKTPVFFQRAPQYAASRAKPFFRYRSEVPPKKRSSRKARRFAAVRGPNERRESAKRVEPWSFLLHPEK